MPFSTMVVDRDGRLLRAFATADGRWRLPIRVDQVDPRYIQALLGYEDNRFYAHRGVDPLAMLRAFGQFMFNGHIVSGGSTITMQVARLLEPRDQRTLGAKLRQTVRAIEIERKLTKSEVLALYLNLAPFGGNLEGVRAASLAYFGHEPRRLTLGEAALLVALPQSPEARRPDRAQAAAKAARDRVLDRLEREGIISAADAARAKAEPVPVGAPPDADARAAGRRSRGGGDAGRQADPAHDRRSVAEEPGGAGARSRARARAGHLDRGAGGGQRERRGAGPRRLGRLLRPAARRRSRYDAGAALARLDLEAFHLRPRLRGRLHPSRDADRRPAGALWLLRADELRPHVPGHHPGAPRAAALAQCAGRRGARPCRAEPFRGPRRPGGQHAGAAEGRDARARDGARRRSASRSTIWSSSMSVSRAAAPRSRSPSGATRPRRCRSRAG